MGGRKTNSDSVWSDLRQRGRPGMYGNLACAFVLVLGSVSLWASSASADVPMPAEGGLEPGKPAIVLTVPATDRPRTLAIVVALRKPGSLAPGVPVSATVEVGGTTLRKVLHLGDPDATWLLRAP